MRRLINQGNLALAQGNRKHNQGLYKDAAEDYDKAVKLYDQARSGGNINQALVSNLNSAYLNLSSALIVDKQYTKALEIINQAMVITSDSLMLTQNFISANYNLGLEHEKVDGQLHSAIESFKTALRKAPENIKILYSLGNALAKNNLLQEACNYLSKILEIHKDSTSDLVTDKLVLNAYCKLYEYQSQLNIEATSTLEAGSKFFHSLSDIAKAECKIEGIFVYNHLGTKYAEHQENSNNTDLKTLLSQSSTFVKDNHIIENIRQQALFKCAHAEKEQGIAILLSLLQINNQELLSQDDKEELKGDLSDIYFADGKSDLAIALLAEESSS